MVLGVFVVGAVVEYSGFVDVYYRCGAYVSDFGRCFGDCFGFMLAVKSTREVPPVRVFVGDVEVPVNYTVLQVDDVYQPKLWVVEFRGHGQGPVRVVSQLRVEAYLLLNFGVGEPRHLKALLLPYWAGRDESRPWVVDLGVEGEVVACTVGKYASRAAVLAGGEWKPASVETGWYRSLVKGVGSALRLEWSSVSTSAIKVAYVVVAAPRGPDRAFVVGLDGLPVPAQFLSLTAGPGVVVEGDGVVSFRGVGYLQYGGRRVELRPNATAVVEGRRCVYVGRTSGGEPLDVTVLFDGRPAASGVGRAEAFCIPGVTKARYRYFKQFPVANVSHVAEAEGNYTLQLVKMEVVVHDVFRLPRERHVVEAPPGTRVVVRVGNFTEAVEAAEGVFMVYPYRLVNAWELVFAVPMAYGAAAAARRRIDELFNMSLLTAGLVLVYFSMSMLLGMRISTFVAYLAVAVLLAVAVAAAFSGDLLVAAVFNAAFLALAYLVAVNAVDAERAVLALSAAALLGSRLGQALFLLSPALATKCSCRGNLEEAKREAFKRVEGMLNAGRKAAEAYLRELAHLCGIRSFGRSAEALALCMANGGLVSWRLYMAVRSGAPEDVAEALRGEAP